MSDAGKPHGPILWESGDNDILTARTPEHPATDRRFTVVLGDLGGGIIQDEADPDRPVVEWGYLRSAIAEAEDAIRAAMAKVLRDPAPLTAAEYRGMIGRAIDEHELTVEVADRLGVELCRPCLEDNGECRLPDSCGRYCDEAGRHGPE